MAVSDALAFVEGSEFRRQAARLLAKRIASDIDLQDLIDQGEAYTDDLIEALLEALRPVILREAALAARSHAATLGLATLGGIDVSRIAARTLEPVIEEALTTLASRVGELARAVTRMLDAGIGEDVIRRTLASEVGAGALLAPVVSVLTATGAGMVNAIEKAVLDESAALTLVEAIENGEPEPMFEWETREDDDVCDDLFENSCAPRHGESLPLDEWEAFGVPGESPTICTIYAKGATSNCRCVLRLSTAVGRSPKPITTREAAEAGRRRADEEIPVAA